MDKNLTEVVFILDRSGSMANLASDTIGGYNSLLARQKDEEGEALLSTVLFDDRIEVLHDRLDISQVAPITSKEYYVRGCTALLDAIGGAIHHIAGIHKLLAQVAPDKLPSKTLFIITTDGLENASRLYRQEKVKEMIELEKEKYGWEFLFLGADFDAISVAGSLGIDGSRAVRFKKDARGQRTNFAAMDESIRRARKSHSAAQLRASLDEDSPLEAIRSDYEARPDED